MHLLFVFALLFPLGSSWVLKTTHQTVIVGLTKNVTLECCYDNKDNGKSHLTDVLGIVIRKYIGSNQWRTHAKVRFGDKNVILSQELEPEVRVMGHAEKPYNSFLSLTWPVSSSNLTGHYACAINGYADNDAPVQVVTGLISIRESKLSMNSLLSLFLDMKKQTKETISAYTQSLIKKMLEALDSLRKDFTSEIAHVKQEFQNETSQPRGGIANEKIFKIVDARMQENWYKKRVWPGGQYALLNTNTGCPKSTTSRWVVGSVKIHTKQNIQSRQGAISKSDHLAQPVFGEKAANYHVNISTCRRATNSSGPAWSKGSYCIHRAGGFCPTGFKQSLAPLDTKDHPELKKDVSGQDVHMDSKFGSLTFSFCCRQDNDPKIPIVLPLDKPFYLYRYKGSCQSVQGAKVSQEWLQINTTFIDNIVAVSAMKPLRFLLCYYTNDAKVLDLPEKPLVTTPFPSPKWSRYRPTYRVPPITRPRRVVLTNNAIKRDYRIKPRFDPGNCRACGKK